MLRGAHAVLGLVIEKCEKIDLPALKHLDEGASVASFVAPYGLQRSTSMPDGEWITTLLTQFDTTISRLRKLHFKNLGALLRLQESLDPELFGLEPPPARC